MGISCSKSCFPKKLRNKSNKEKTKQVNDDLPLKYNNVSTHQYLLTEKLSSSEVNLLNKLRQEKDNCKRPTGISFTKFIKNKPVIRIGSWNLNNLGVEKLKNPGVLTVICLTILENNLSILALQEITNKDVAALICQELNKPQLTKIKLQRNSHQWDYIMSEVPVGKIFQGYEFGVLLYDKSAKVEILKSYQLTSPKDSSSFSRNPFLINMKIETNHILMVIFHVKAATFVNKVISKSKMVDEINDISVLAMVLEEKIKPDHKVIMLGDFNEHPNHESFDSLKNEGYMYCINADLATNTSEKNGKSFDNIWINKACEELYTGKSGVIKEGLNHPQIPKTGMYGWGGVVSDHCPVWADIFTHL